VAAPPRSTPDGELRHPIGVMASALFSLSFRIMPPRKIFAVPKTVERRGFRGLGIA
jgi:hypothetical protein